MALGVVAAAGGLAAFHFIPRAVQTDSVAKVVAPRSSRGSAPLATPGVTTSVAEGAAPTPLSSNPSPGNGKTSPVAPAPAPSGLYPYPVDAGGTVARGSLTLTPSALAAGGTATVTVTASATGWVTGQQIFIYLGQKYEVKLTGPGASAQLTVPAGLVGSSGIQISGFQFPSNSIAAPIDGYGNATLGALG